MNYTVMVRHAGLVIIIAMSARIIAAAIDRHAELHLYAMSELRRELWDTFHAEGDDDEILAETPDE